MMPYSNHPTQEVWQYYLLHILQEENGFCQFWLIVPFLAEMAHQSSYIEQGCCFCQIWID